jgi:hypothetical protein
MPSSMRTAERPQLASAILGRNMLLDGAVGVGLTDDSPNYSASISLPVRFSTPTF